MRGREHSALVAMLLLGAEASLTYLAVSVLARSPLGGPLPWLWLWGTGCAALLLSVILRRLRDPWARWALLALSGVVASLVSVRALSYPDAAPLDFTWLVDAARVAAGVGGHARARPQLVAGAVFGFWLWEGARRPPDAGAVRETLMVGPVLVAAITAAALLVIPDSASLLVRYFALFFALCLVGVSVAERGGQGTVRRALSGLLPIALPLAAVGIVVLAFSGGLGSVASAVGGSLLDVANAVIAAISALLSILFHGNPPAATPGRLQRMPCPYQDPGMCVHRPGGGLSIEPATLAMAGLAVALVLAAWYVLGHVRLGGSDEGEERESVWSARGAGRGLTSVVRSIGRRRIGREDPLRGMLSDPVWRYSAEVRLAYREVEREFGRSGRGRLPPETASEHARRLGGGALGELVSVYNRARYGTRPVARELAARARELAKELRVR